MHHGDIRLPAIMQLLPVMAHRRTLCFYGLYAWRGNRVILDWVPAHFPRDTFGMSNLTEHACMSIRIQEEAHILIGEH